MGLIQFQLRTSSNRRKKIDRYCERTGSTVSELFRRMVAAIIVPAPQLPAKSKNSSLDSSRRSFHSNAKKTEILLIRIESELKIQFKEWCKKEGVTMTSVLEEMIDCLVIPRIWGFEQKAALQAIENIKKRAA